MKRLVFLGLVLLLIPVAAPVAAQNAIQDELAETAAELEALQAQQADAQGDVSVWQNKIADTTGRMNQIQAELNAAEVTLADLNLAITETQAAVSFTELEISQREDDLELTAGEIVDTHHMVVTQAVELFKRGGGQIETTFDYESVQEAAVAVRYGSTVIAETNRALDELEELRGQQEQQVDLIEAQKAELNEQLDRLATAQAKAEVARVEVEAKQAQLQAELTNQKALLQSFKTEIALIEIEIEGKEAEQEKLIQLLAAEQERGGIAPGELFPPLNPSVISSGYGPRLHPILGYSRMHTGLDINGDSGDEISASASGRVIWAGPRGGYGNTIIIDHGGGMATLYAHQSSLVAKNGDRVVVGDLIGYVGSTGLSTGPHLHFEVRIDGAHTDPAPFFG